MKVFGFFAFLCLAAIGSAATPDQIAKAFMEKNKIPGLAYVILQNGGIIGRGALGVSDLTTKEPITLSSVFPIASLSKPFVAFGILSLVEKGQLKLDDPVGKYVSDLPEDWKPIKIIRLLDHSSGIPDQYNSGKFPVYNTERLKSDELIQRLTTLPLNFAPGNQYQYSNGNYVLLAKVIEKVAGVPHEQYLADKIFSPLGMKSTKALSPDDLVAGVHGYYLAKDGPQPATFNPDWAFGNGALGSTVLDLAKLDTALYTQKILKTSTLAFVTTPQPLNDGKLAPYAMGWGIGSRRGSRVIAHTGKVGGWQSFFGRFADHNLTVIVLSNNRDVNLDTLATDLAGTVVPSLALNPIRDEYPDLTKSHQQFIESIAAGTVDLGRLNDGMQKDYYSKSNWSGMKDMLSKPGKITSFQPVERKVEGENRYMSKYRIDQGVTSWTATFYFNGEGVITGFMLMVA